VNSRFKLEEALCPLCRDNKTKTIFVGRDRLCKRDGQFPVVRCETCGLTFTNPRPTQETMGYFYPDEYAPYQAFSLPYVRIYNMGETLFEKIKNELKYQVLKNYYGYHGLQPPCRFPFLVKLPRGIKKLILKLSCTYFRRNYYRIPVWKEKGKALDIGCGSGAYLLLLKKIGWDVAGVDINDNTSQEIKEAKIPVLTGKLQELKLEGNSFDLITLWHVLEHLHSPLETLQEIHRLLKDNGILLIEVPNSASALSKLFKSNWFAWDLPRHLCHLSPKSLSKLSNYAGFKISNICYLSINNLGMSAIYWMEENIGLKYDSERLKKNKFLFYFLKFCGNILAMFHASDIIYIEARKY